MKTSNAKTFQWLPPTPANILHKSNVTQWLHFGNLRKLLSANADGT